MRLAVFICYHVEDYVSIKIVIAPTVAAVWILLCFGANFDNDITIVKSESNIDYRSRIMLFKHLSGQRTSFSISIMPLPDRTSSIFSC